MPITRKTLAISMLTLLALTLAGCSGGGGSRRSSPPATPPVPPELTGFPLQVTSNAGHVVLTWAEPGNATLLVSSDPDCDWSQSVTLCAHGFALDAVTSPLMLDASHLQVERNYYFVLVTEEDRSVIAGGTPWRYVPNTRFTALTLVDDVLYAGGNFEYLGPYIGGGISIDAGTGAWRGALPRVSGVADAVIPDGTGGWYVAGSSIARIRANGAVDLSWTPPQNFNFIWSLALDSSTNTLYVGGHFTEVDGQPHSRLIAVDTLTGNIRDWNPVIPAGGVAQMIVNSAANTLYVCNNMGDSAGGSVRAISTTTGELLWMADLVGSPFSIAFDTTTNRLIVSGIFVNEADELEHSLVALDSNGNLMPDWGAGTTAFASAMFIDHASNALYLVGEIHFPGDAQHSIATVNLATGQLISPLADTDDWIARMVFDESRRRLHVRGYFNEVDGQPAPGFATLNADTGALIDTPLLPLHAINGYGAIALDPVTDSLYLTGNILTRGRAQQGLAAYDTATGALLDWDPEMDGTVYALAVDASAGNLYVGGEFDWVGEDERHNLAAFDLQAQTLTPWHPAADGTVRALLADTVAGVIYAGGEFDEVAEEPRGRLAAIDSNTGELLPWEPVALDGSVRAMLLANNQLYAGGQFSIAGVELRANLAAFELGSAALSDWNPGTNSSVYALAQSADGRVFVGGFFTEVDEEARNGLAVFQTDGTLDDWHPDLNGSVNVMVLDLATEQLFFGGDFTTFGDTTRQRFAALHTISNQLSDLAPSFGRWGIDGLVPDTAAGVIYAAGSFTVMNNETSPYLVALDAETGDKLW